MNDRAAMKGFNRFLLQVLHNAKLWLFFMLCLSFFRISFILFFRSRIEPGVGLAEILTAALNGLRYDSMASTWWVLIPFLAGVASGFADLSRAADRLRGFFGAAFIILTAVAWVITFGYFKEYNDQFNYRVFNLYYDDTRAILQTIWADYHPIPALIIIVLISILGFTAKKRFMQRSFLSLEKAALRTFSFMSRIVLGFLILSLLVAASRGSVGRRPAQRKDAAISRDAFLNKAVLNPYFSLHFAVKDHIQQTGLSGLESFLPDRDVRKAAQALFQKQQAYHSLDAYLEKRAKGPKTAPPRHIFLVVMESYDAWALLDKYAALGLTNALTELGREGLHLRNFLPASDGTMQSLTAIITGLPYSHVEINYQTTAMKPYPSSLFETFKRLGYRTRLFYGGYLSWQRLGDFAHDQGAEEIYGAPHMSAGVETHEWGVDDEYLLDFVSDTVNDGVPSFNLIMTTSYHPPFNVDVEAKGFPLKKIPDDLAPLFDNTTGLNLLGHLWYSDKCLGDFVQNVEEKLPRTLFAFTGDHYGRKFINAKPDFFESSAVPFILYGNEVLNGLRFPRDAAGSHIDIGPTLVELAAPAGFPYYSVGQDLLSPRREFFGIGFYRVVGKDFLLELSSPPRFHPLPGKTLPDNLPDIPELTTMFNQTYGIGWWRVRRGETF